MILNKPIITEKTLADQQNGRYAFYVNLKSTKQQIASEFEQIFGHKPESVNTIKVKGKTKTDWKKRLPIKKPDQKKAIITIDKNKKIESLMIKTK